MKNWFEENWAHLFLACFLGLFGVMISYSFDQRPFWLGLIGATVGTVAAYGFGEWRRFAEQTKGWWVVYVIGFILAATFAYLTSWSVIPPECG